MEDLEASEVGWVLRFGVSQQGEELLFASREEVFPHQLDVEDTSPAQVVEEEGKRALKPERVE
jgi:hypothetical protein